MRRYQRQPTRIATDPHPLNLPERMLDELSRLFLAESLEAEHEANRLYLRGDYERGAAAELRAQGLEFDSRELADLAFVRFRFRRAHELRNLAPWEREDPPDDPF